MEKAAENPFLKARYTAVVSDLHLCEAQRVNAKYPLWKKYKTKEFFFDHEFKEFLNIIATKAKGEPVELVLNGDIFDFDSMMLLPDKPPYRISWLERIRGLHPSEEKSVFKIKQIIAEHPVWFQALSHFVEQGHRVVFTIGNHDLELHWKAVQDKIVQRLGPHALQRVRFCEWFYISNEDTLIEHGNQYDPYCICEDPVSPYVKRYNRFEVRVPFGNLTTRYLLNGVGFINPHLDANFLMSFKEFFFFFLKYIVKAQPFIVMSWFWGATVCLVQSFIDKLRPPAGDPLSIEDRIEHIAFKANTQPRVVRELKQLFVTPAASYPLRLAKELYLDRTFLVLMTFLILYLLFLQLNILFGLSVLWFVLPFALLSPFIFFYAQSVVSVVHEYKEPKEKILNLTGMIANVSRVIYGHTHVVRHESIGAIEHLNSGTWSPAFEDVECTKPVGSKTFIWIEPGEDSKGRAAKLYKLANQPGEGVLAIST